MRVSRSVSERPREDLLSRRPQELSTLPLTDVSITGNACCEASLEERRVEESSVLQLEQVCILKGTKFSELQFSRGYTLGNNKQILHVVTQHHLAFHPLFGYISRARVTLHEDGSYKAHILMRELENDVA